MSASVEPEPGDEKESESRQLQGEIHREGYEPIPCPDPWKCGCGEPPNVAWLRHPSCGPGRGLVQGQSGHGALRLALTVEVRSKQNCVLAAPSTLGRTIAAATLAA